MTFDDLYPLLRQKGLSSEIIKMRDNGTLEKKLPEVFALIGVPERLDYHPEGDSFSHTMLALDRADDIVLPSVDDLRQQLNWCVLCHDLGKALTPKDILPQHIGHEFRGVHVINSLCARMEVPIGYWNISTMVCQNHMRFHLTTKMKPAKIYKMLKEVTEDFHDISLLGLIYRVAVSDFMGRGTTCDSSMDNVRNCYKICSFTLGEILSNSDDVFSFGEDNVLKEQPFMQNREQKLISIINKPVIKYRELLLNKKLDN